MPEDEPAVSDDPFGFSGGDSEPATAPTRDKGKFSQKSRSPEKGKAAAQDAGESGEARPAYRGAERGGSKILLYTLIFGVLALGGGITTVVLMINAKSEARKKENDAKAAKEAKIAADKAEAAKIEDAAAAATAAMAAKEAPKEAPKAASKGTKGEAPEKPATVPKAAGKSGKQAKNVKEPVAASTVARALRQVPRLSFLTPNHRKCSKWARSPPCEHPSKPLSNRCFASFRRRATPTGSACFGVLLKAWRARAAS